jgi:hypothetical protein
VEEMKKKILNKKRKSKTPETEIDSRGLELIDIFDFSIV